MNLERVLFGFVIILALSFTFAFVMGGIDDASHHNVWLLTIAILINLIATGLKLGDRSQVGALLLASSLAQPAIELLVFIAFGVPPAANDDRVKRLEVVTQHLSLDAVAATARNSGAIGREVQPVIQVATTAVVRNA